MRYNLVGKRSVPPEPYHYCLVCVPMEAIPFVAGALRIKKAKYWWKTPEDVKRANDLLTRFENGLLMDCTLPIVNAIDRINTRLDAALFAQYHTVTGEGTDADPFVYNPALLQAPEEPFTPPASMVVNSQQTKELVHNLVDGTGTSLTTENRNIRDMLEAIRLAVSEKELDTEDVEALLQAILLLL